MFSYAVGRAEAESEAARAGVQHVAKGTATTIASACRRFKSRGKREAVSDVRGEARLDGFGLDRWTAWHTVWLVAAPAWCFASFCIAYANVKLLEQQY